MNNNKLTYYQICLLASQGNFGAIPSEYKIKWFCDNKPHRVIDLEVNGDCVKLEKFANPDKVKISGEYVVHVPSPIYIYIDDVNELEEYGVVCLKTDFILSELKFIYESEESAKRLNDYIGPFAEKKKKKESVVFNIDINLHPSILKVYNAFPIECSFCEDNAIVNLNYDYFTIDY